MHMLSLWWPALWQIKAVLRQHASVMVPPYDDFMATRRELDALFATWKVTQPWNLGITWGCLYRRSDRGTRAWRPQGLQSEACAR
jgi:hypothetical protein